MNKAKLKRISYLSVIDEDVNDELKMHMYELKVRYLRQIEDKFKELNEQINRAQGNVDEKYLAKGTLYLFELIKRRILTAIDDILRHERVALKTELTKLTGCEKSRKYALADFEKKLNEQLEKIENIYFKPDESLLKRNLLGTLMVNLIECNVIKESFEINNLMRLSQAKNKSKEINRVLYMEIEDKLISSSYLFGLQICEFREKLIYKETAENHLLHASVMCKADINFNKSKFKQTVSSVYDEILLTLDHIQQGKQNLCKFNLLSNNLIIYPTIFTRRIYNMVCCTHYGKRYLYTIEIDELNNMRKNSVYIYRLFKKGPIICGEVTINEPECMTVNDVDILVLTSSNNIAKLDSSKKEFKIMQLPSVLVDAKGLGVDRYSNIMTTAFENGNKFRCLFILNYDNLSIMKKIEMAGINNDFYHIYIHYDRLFIYNEEKIIGFVFE